jgi:hypothetical protein
LAPKTGANVAGLKSSPKKEQIMKTIPIILGSALASLMLGCSSTPVTLAPVGPGPIVSENTGGKGQLEVFSALRGHTEGNNPTWYQHTDYYIYNDQNQRVQFVDNKLGHYDRTPRMVELPPGRYIVKARAKGYLWVKVPVVVAAGKTTEVHLDNAWAPSPEATADGLVSAPAGYPVGWRANVSP